MLFSNFCAHAHWHTRSKHGGTLIVCSKKFLYQLAGLFSLIFGCITKKIENNASQDLRLLLDTFNICTMETLPHLEKARSNFAKVERGYYTN